MKILLLDDDESMGEIAARILQHYGHEVLAITDFRKLQSVMTDFAPELLIMDIDLHGADGRELCKQIKRSENSPRVILYSAMTDIENVQNEFGAESFLQKPFTKHQLLSVVANCS